MKQRSPLLPIFLIVLVDVLGFTIVIPLLAYYAERFGASPLVATTLVSVYAVCSLISTPIIGNLSDKVGRRRMLLISQAGTLAGFLMLAWSHSLWMVFVGRILDGITAGNLSLAQAYISDHTKPENRAKAFGVIGVAFGIGFMFGPGLGGTLAEYGLHVPFLVAAGLSALSIFCTATLLKKETPPQEVAPSTGPMPAGRRPGAFDIATYGTYFKRPRLGSLYLQFFLFSFAFSCFTSGFALFAERRFSTHPALHRVPGEMCKLTVDEKLETSSALPGTILLDGQALAHGEWWIAGPKTIFVAYEPCQKLQSAQKLEAKFPWTAHEVGLQFMFTGFLGILLQGGLIGRLVKRFGEIRLVLAGFVAAAAAYVLLGFAFTVSMVLLVATISAFGNGVLRPVITSRITQVAGRHEQGVALGISGSLSSFAMMLAPPTGGALIDHQWLLGWALVPASVAAVGFIVALATPDGKSREPELSSPP
ncbi:MAG: MFS transporter [Kofleriaceae bacterium]|nr:MFS transporter [Kofleriaceae bacterium]